MNKESGNITSVIGPGIVLAATGVGAGDLIATATGGAAHGMTILWAVLIGAILKYFLNEGIGRWQLGSGLTVLEGWQRHLPPWVSWTFLFYLLLWSFMVAGALINACALAAHTIFPQLSLGAWGILHSLLGLALVALGRYRALEFCMKWIVGVLFLVVLICAIALQPPVDAFARGLFIPHIPQNSLPLILGLIGGIGGSLTVLCYSYWIREKNWNQPSALKWVHWDLSVAYVLTALFGIAMMVIAAASGVGQEQGSQILLNLASILRETLGPWAQSLFLVGFYAAVFSSLLGVWQGVPYLFADFLYSRKPDSTYSGSNLDLTRTPAYFGYLLFLALPPLLLLLYNRPVWIVILYAILGSLFMPFLAATLLWMNNRSSWVGALKNSWLQNLGLALNVLLFSGLCIREIIQRFVG